MKTNQLTKHHQEVFTRAGWVVQPLKENELTEKIGEETMLHLFSYKGFTTRTININYARETLLVVENDTRGKLDPHVKYDARLPEMVDDTLRILQIIETIDQPMLNRLFYSK